MKDLLAIFSYLVFISRGVQPTHQTQLDPTQLARLGRFLGLGGLA